MAGTEALELEALVDVDRRLQALEERVANTPDSRGLNMVVFSGELDRVLAAFTIATGAAACGRQVSLFFTFWGTAALRRPGAQKGRKTWVERTFGWFLRGGVGRLRLSRLDMGGLGRRMLAGEMRRKNIAGLQELIDLAGSLGVRIRVCEMSMDLMGIQRDELIEYPNLEFCGVAMYVEDASHAGITLFV